MTASIGRLAQQGGSCTPPSACLPTTVAAALSPFLPPCRDTAVLLDQTDQVETAIDYATGALVNAQVGRCTR